MCIFSHIVNKFNSIFKKDYEKVRFITELSISDLEDFKDDVII